MAVPNCMTVTYTNKSVFKYISVNANCQGRNVFSRGQIALREKEECHEYKLPLSPTGAVRLPADSLTSWHLSYRGAAVGLSLNSRFVSVDLCENMLRRSPLTGQTDLQ